MWAPNNVLLGCGRWVESFSQILIGINIESFYDFLHVNIFSIVLFVCVYILHLYIWKVGLKVFFYIFFGPHN